MNTPVWVQHIAFQVPDLDALLAAGTIVGSGTVSNRDGNGGPGRPVAAGGLGYSCIAQVRMIETILKRGAGNGVSQRWRPRPHLDGRRCGQSDLRHDRPDRGGRPMKRPGEQMVLMQVRGRFNQYPQDLPISRSPPSGRFARRHSYSREKHRTNARQQTGLVRSRPAA